MQLDSKITGCSCTVNFRATVSSKFPRILIGLFQTKYVLSIEIFTQYMSVENIKPKLSKLGQTYDAETLQPSIGQNMK